MTGFHVEKKDGTHSNGDVLIGEDDIKVNNPGKHTIIGVDTFDGGDWEVGQYDTFNKAVEVAKKKGGVMTKMHVYDEDGKHVANAGSF